MSNAATPTVVAKPGDLTPETSGLALPRPARLPIIPRTDPLLARLDAWLDVAGTERECSIKLRNVHGLSGAKYVVDLFDGDAVVACGLAAGLEAAVEMALKGAE